MSDDRVAGDGLPDVDAGLSQESVVIPHEQMAAELGVTPVELGEWQAEAERGYDPATITPVEGLRSEPDPVLGITIPIHADGTTDWRRFAAELRTSGRPVGAGVMWEAKRQSEAATRERLRELMDTTTARSVGTTGVDETISQLRGRDPDPPPPQLVDNLVYGVTPDLLATEWALVDENGVAYSDGYATRAEAQADLDLGDEAKIVLTVAPCVECNVVARLKDAGWSQTEALKQAQAFGRMVRVLIEKGPLPPLPQGEPS